MVIYQIKNSGGGAKAASEADFLISKEYSLFKILFFEKSSFFALNISLRYLFFLLIFKKKFIYFEHTVFELSNHNYLIKLLYRKLIKLPEVVVTPTREHALSLKREKSTFSFQLNLKKYSRPNCLNIKNSRGKVSVLFWGRNDYQKNEIFYKRLVQKIVNKNNIIFDFVNLSNANYSNVEFLNLLQKVDVYVSVSNHESFNRVLYDATFSGLITVVSDVDFGNKKFGMFKFPLELEAWLNFFNNLKLTDEFYSECDRLQNQSVDKYEKYIDESESEIRVFKSTYNL
jgi:hypothetical protein